MSNSIKRFEDFVAWQKGRVLAARIYKVTDEGRFAKDFGLKDQIRRAAVSIMSNIAEGFERGRPAEFHQFLSIAKASCAELRSQLYVALDAGYLNQEVFSELMMKAGEVGQIIGGLRTSVERRRNSS
ncbi:MAG TPA: four helix bundle protein [Pyrinomonadaceae bacterium]|jgi:four helix bundle protein|nr:four helix bundle protein [Pyrinomonadaceae bacterium]